MANLNREFPRDACMVIVVFPDVCAGAQAPTLTANGFV
jgi:hypothetical protein